MTTPLGPLTPPPPASPPPPAAGSVPVMSYAGIGTDYVVPTGVKVLLGFLAAFHLLLGVPLILWPLVHLAMTLVSGYFDPGAFGMLAIGFAAGAPNVACGVGMLWRRQRGTWRGIHAVLFVLCGLELLVFIGGTAMAVSAKHDTGWGQLGVVFGVFFVIVASVVFWLHAATKLLLLRVNVRRAFGFEYDDRVRLQRGGTLFMMSMYGILLVVGTVVYVLR